MKTTCICVLNYNNGLKTVRCISGILNQTLQNFRVVVIDNHSTDDSLEIIQAFLEKKHIKVIHAEPKEGGIQDTMEAEGVYLIRSDRNGGYAYGNNLGIRLAKSLADVSYLLILNNDVVLKENFLEEMVGRYEELRIQYKTPAIALGAVELGEDGKVHHGGFHYLHVLTGLTFSKPWFPSFKYIVGSCIFTDIGAPLMDESFFLYFDDTQYSIILRRGGYVLESSPRSVFIHEVGGTFKKEIQWIIFRSMRRFYLLNYPLLLPVVVPVRLLLIAYLRLKEKLAGHSRQ